MKYSSRYIIFVAISRYLSDEQISNFKTDIGKEFPKGNIKFLRILNRYFDFEKLKDAPLLWQDIWIYNFIKYDRHGGRKKLLSQYETEIIIPSEKAYEKFISWLR